ncbi:hypothetical protein Pyn_18600 [Prunus yedoensis var. nudiflora]|uniref:HMA domain-containing protein n=1 Tax=Prunus yedoensis var. nudiflora TaxID=2094558 RepID=A0A314ZHS1_PRUYE|nr:hypothetical protein Pyn_18600 [Prunus yedoensis var. nudiflora]
MAPSPRDLQLTQVSPGARKLPEMVTGGDFGDLEDVRLLDSYDNSEGVEQGMQRVQVRVSGMTCAACSNSVEGALKSVNGVLTASVALLQNRADVVFDPRLVKDEDIKNAIEDAGFEAEVIPEQSTNGIKQHGTLLGQFSIGGMTCAACVNSVEGILKGLPGVKRAVVALATSLGEVEYDPTVISKDDIVNAIEDAGFDASLVQSSQQDKIILGVAGVFSETDAQTLEAIISNLKGVRHFRFDRISRELEILFDPEVVTSRSVVDGIEGASNEKFKLQVANPYTRMTSKDVEEAANMFRLFISSLSLSVASIFVPTVVAMALLTLLGWYIAGAFGAYPEKWLPENGNHFVFALMFSISVVVIACPCALGLATPTAVMVATGVGANNGVLIKGGDALERAQKVKYVIFDKTGTLTQGKATVTTVKVFTGMDRGEFLKLVASAEASSEHPLAKAIVQYARHFHFFDDPSVTNDAPNNNKETTISGWLFDVSEFSALPGRGIQCFIDGKLTLIGNRKLMTESGIDIPTHVENFVVELEESAKTGILVAYEGNLIGVLGVADPLKREAAIVIEGLHKMGVIPVMVTGDNWRTAQAVAKERNDMQH